MGKIFGIFLIVCIIFSGCTTMQPDTVYLGHDTKEENVIGISSLHADFWGAHVVGAGPSSAYQEAIDDAKGKAKSADLINIKGFRENQFWPQVLGNIEVSVGVGLISIHALNGFPEEEIAASIFGGVLIVIGWFTRELRVFRYEVVAESELHSETFEALKEQDTENSVKISEEESDGVQDNGGIVNGYEKISEHSDKTNSFQEDTYPVRIPEQTEDIILFNKGNDSDGWQYLELTKKDLGKLNWKEAMKTCDELVLNGNSDWQLPSKDDLNLIYVNFHKKGKGEFNGRYYWSSTEFDSDNAWIHDFKYGDQITVSKGYPATVRAVRKY